MGRAGLPLKAPGENLALVAQVVLGWWPHHSIPSSHYSQKNPPLSFVCLIITAPQGQDMGRSLGGHHSTHRYQGYSAGGGTKDFEGEVKMTLGKSGAQ